MMMNRVNQKVLVLLATAGIALACAGRAPTEPATTNTLALRAGQEHPLPGAAGYLAMIKVEEDSRCPIDAVCVWEGNAAVSLSLRPPSGPAATWRLNTTTPPKSFTALGYEVRLDSLLPAPRVGQHIEPGDYVAYVTVMPMAP